MSKYKIKITWDGMYYNQVLYKRVFLLAWKPIERGSTFYPLSNNVLRWQKEFNIKDKDVKIYQ